MYTARRKYVKGMCYILLKCDQLNLSIRNVHT